MCKVILFLGFYKQLEVNKKIKYWKITLQARILGGCQHCEFCFFFFLDYNIEIIQRIFLATAYIGKLMVHWKSKLFSRALLPQVGDEACARDYSPRSLWVVLILFAFRLKRRKNYCGLGWPLFHVKRKST